MHLLVGQTQLLVIRDMSQKIVLSMFYPPKNLEPKPLNGVFSSFRRFAVTLLASQI